MTDRHPVTTARNGPSATPSLLPGRSFRQKINRPPALHAFVDGDVGQSGLLSEPLY